MLTEKTSEISHTNVAFLFGVPITICSLDMGIRLIEEIIKEKRPKLVVLANAHTLNLACELELYRKVLKNAGLILRDGTGVGWALRRKGSKPGHNFVGTDFIPVFCKRTNGKKYKLFMLGARPGLAERAAKTIKRLAPEIQITGCHHGYFNDRQRYGIINKVNQTNSDILLVAMGNPKQEIWIESCLEEINVPACIGVGALFDYLSGHMVRAPRWVLNAGMEWVFRLAVEPKRLWKRYVIGNLKFIFRVYQETKL